MTPPRSTIILVLLVAAVLLAAGCAGAQPAAIHPMNNSTTMASPVPTIITLAPVTLNRTPCPVSDNQSSWIMIDPVERIERGEIIRIKGTTNIPAGNHLVLNVYPGSFHPHCRCCYDDQLTADVIIRGGESCANTFSFWFDSTNFVPDEYIITVTYPENNSESNTLIVPLFENTTPLPVPAGNLSVTVPVGTLLAALQPPDVARGDIQTISGIRNGTPYAIEYSIRDATLDPVCRPYCEGENFHGIIHSAVSEDGNSRFAIRFNTVDMKPGRYAADLDLTCLADDAPVKVWFNITENTPVTAP